MAKYCLAAFCALSLVGLGSYASIAAPKKSAIVAKYNPPKKVDGTAPVARYGQLRIKGPHVVDKTGTPVSLAGMSFFWSTTGWGQEKYYNAKAVEFLARDWNISVLRAALGVEPKGSYIDDPAANKKRVETVLQAGINNGLYVMIDWHAHHAHDRPELAEAFFSEMAQKYGHLENTLYQIYNEPLNTADWNTQVKPYHERIIRAIRKHDPDNIIIVGTPTWSQDVDIATANPISIDKNIAYSLHFYAGSHKQSLRDRVQKTIDKGFALWVDEMGTVLHTADGPLNYEETAKWFDLIHRNKLSFNNWAVSDKAETASILKPGTNPNGGWRDSNLTESGLLMRTIIRNWPNKIAIAPVKPKTE